MSWQLLKDMAKPAVEIGILAVGIYYVLNFVRGTRGAAVFTGFLVVALSLLSLTTFLKLQVLQWILGTFTTILSFAVVVLFQPEIRRMLAQVGNLQLFNPVQDQRENIEVIIQTVERLAEVKIGALIAIEQSVQLLDLVESSVPIDTVATPEMFETIFFPNNAIHDGGVIMKGNRITHAACIFPLTQRQDLSKSLGTRHRAAIGLSEEADAVIVVVSEETGMISHAHQGQLVRGLTLEALRAYLSTMLIKSNSPAPSRWYNRLGLWLKPRPTVGGAFPPAGPAGK
ncbi:MAG TPA: TIGR00159 family protein [Verrucomicrobiales bacterium]|nr:TIGR00159 family protein [Verrucomicrobiales bacterium]